MADSWIPMLLFLGFLFVSLTLILGLGIVSREEERETDDRPVVAASSGVGSGFLLTSNASSASEPRFVNRVASVAPIGSEADRRQWAEPPARGIRKGAGATVDDLVAQLEEFLRGEAAAVAAFASAPSVGGLWGESAAGLDVPQGADEGNGNGRRNPS